MRLFQFLFRTDANPYHRLVLKESKSDEATKALLAGLSGLAFGFSQGADAIYRQLLIEQFKDYEQRYGCTLLAHIDIVKQACLVRAVRSFMLYTFCHQIAESGKEQTAIPLTSALYFEIYKEKPAQGRGDFLDYIMYQNPHFEDRNMAPAFKFGNEIAQIMETMDMAFSMMASQQAILIAEITRRILNGLIKN